MMILKHTVGLSACFLSDKWPNACRHHGVHCLKCWRGHLDESTSLASTSITWAMEFCPWQSVKRQSSLRGG